MPGSSSTIRTRLVFNGVEPRGRHPISAPALEPGMRRVLVSHRFRLAAGHRRSRVPYHPPVASHCQRISVPLSGPASPIAEVRGVTDRQSNLAGVSGRQFENGSCRTRASEDAPGPAALDDFHDLVGAVEEYDIDGALHEPCVNGPAARNE